MAETLHTSFNDAEGDPDNKKGRKRKSADTTRIAIPLPIERGSESDSTDAKPSKELPKEAPKAFLEKLIGKTEPTTESSNDKPRELEQVEEEPNTSFSAAETSEDRIIDETVAAEAERSVAEDLADGVEISLQEIGQVPPSRDEHIVAEALDIATQDEKKQEAVPTQDAQEELPVTETPVEAGQTTETEPVVAGEAEDIVAASEVQAPEVPIAYMQTPRATLNPFRSRPYTGRTRNVPVPPPVTPPTVSFGGPVGTGGGSLPSNPNVYGAAASYRAESSTLRSQEVRRAMDDVEMQSRQRGRREGVLAGLLVGGGIEHFRHKRREKKLAKQHQKEIRSQQKRVERLENDYAAARQEQQAERTKTNADIANLRLTQEAEHKEHDKKMVEARRVATKEQAVQQHSQEQAQIEEGLSIPKDHHVERSAWHNIEVDKSGRAVQESAFEYGHEYYQERAHEISRAQQQQIDSAAGEVALVAAALSDTQSGAQGLATQGQVARQQQDRPSQQLPSTLVDDSTPKKIIKTITTPPESPVATLIWLGILLIILIFILVLAR